MVDCGDGVASCAYNGVVLNILCIVIQVIVILKISSPVTGDQTADMEDAGNKKTCPKLRDTSSVCF